jgi:acyl carrier protein
MPSPSDTFAVFVTLVSQIVAIDVDPTTLTADTTLAGDLALDSISLISLMALTEERFGISVAEHAEAVANLRTIGDAVELVDSLAVERC